VLRNLAEAGTPASWKASETHPAAAPDPVAAEQIPAAAVALDNRQPQAAQRSMCCDRICSISE
jgi:hypothetical protein